ncbi:uncharacterized protein EV422DRAFT_485288, partial [Fimicolochytrium jonesii]|uniref:uncharacterized protein n=1 Tax=Fimicolochytrium jonesii TaxID=1396493 RepID=UPI0022FF0D15
TFRSFVEHVLSTTRVSSAVIVLALKYLDRIKDSRNLLPADSPLRRPDSEQLVLLVSLMLANKFADDERFTNSAWASVADVDLAIVNRAEMDALEAIRWKLTVDERDYTKWVETVTSHAHLAVQ